MGKSFKNDFKEYFNDILTMVVDLFEDYVCVSIDEELSTYIAQNTTTNHISLHICYLLMSLSFSVETKPDDA